MPGSPLSRCSVGSVVWVLWVKEYGLGYGTVASWMLEAEPEGGGGTASLKVSTHYQTTAPAFRHCPPLSHFFTAPCFWGSHTTAPPPPKKKKKNQTVWIQTYKLVLLLCSKFEVRSWPPLNFGVHCFRSAWPFGSGYPFEPECQTPPPPPREAEGGLASFYSTQVFTSTYRQTLNLL